MHPHKHTHTHTYMFTHAETHTLRPARKKGRCSRRLGSQLMYWKESEETAVWKRGAGRLIQALATQCCSSAGPVWHSKAGGGGGWDNMSQNPVLRLFTKPHPKSHAMPLKTLLCPRLFALENISFLYQIVGVSSLISPSSVISFRFIYLYSSSVTSVVLSRVIFEIFVIIHREHVDLPKHSYRR